MTDPTIQARLEYLRGEIEAERISLGEIAELEDLAEHISPGDTQLLEWAGVPEHPETEEPMTKTILEFNEQESAQLIALATRYAADPADLDAGYDDAELDQRDRDAADMAEMIFAAQYRANAR